MSDIAIYTLTSELHDEQAVTAVTREFLLSLGIEYHYCGSDYSDYGRHQLSLIYVRTGGTEGIFRRLLPQLQSQSSRPFFLLTSGKSNSLAASLEILSFLRQNNMQGEILHGTPDFIATRIRLLAQAEAARHSLQGMRLGIIGQPSDWLIASHADANVVRRQTGIELVELDMDELLQRIGSLNDSNSHEGAERIYEALKSLVADFQLQGFTLRCFDLLTSVHNTGCLALARLNAEGIVAGCEGDVPSLLSMAVSHALTGFSGFQANPAYIDTTTGRLLFAHCTIPLNMVQRYEFDTHFESGIGVGIRGYMQPGPVTLFKLSGHLSRYFVAEGRLIQNQAEPDLCRTQQVIQLDTPAEASYFLSNPIGNHHVIILGHQKALIEETLRTIVLNN